MLQTPSSFNVFELKGCRELPAELVDAELVQAEKRLQAWENNNHYQKVALLAKIADLLPDQSGKLSVLIKAEIDALLNRSFREIALL